MFMCKILANMTQVSDVAPGPLVTIIVVCGLFLILNSKIEKLAKIDPEYVKRKLSFSQIFGRFLALKKKKKTINPS
jgi:hypothetical protein